MMRFSKLYIVLFNTLLTLSFLFTNSARAVDYSALKIGLVLPFTGMQKEFANEAMQAVELAQQDIGIASPEIMPYFKVLSLDSQSSPNKAQEVVENAIKMKRIDVVIGSISDSMAMALNETASKSETILILPYLSNPDIMKALPKFTVSTAINEADQVRLLAQFALNDLHAKTSIMVKSSLSSGPVLNQAFKDQYMRGGGKLLSTITLDEGKDPANLVQTIRKSKPGAIYFSGFHGQIAPLLKGLRETYIKIPIIADEHWDHPDFFKELGDASEGNFVLSQFSPLDPDERVQKFVKRFQARFDRTPTKIAALMYDSVVLLAAAFKKTHSYLKDRLIYNLKNAEVIEGATGAFTMKDGVAFKNASILETGKTAFQFKSRTLSTHHH